MNLHEFTTKRREMISKYGKALAEGSADAACKKELVPLVKFSRMPEFRLINSIVRDWINERPEWNGVSNVSKRS